MKITETTPFTLAALALALLVTAIQAAPSASSPADAARRSLMMSCGQTDYCSSTDRKPDCVTYGVGFQLCDIIYPKGGVKFDTCVYCVKKNCNDTLCNDLPD